MAKKKVNPTQTAARMVMDVLKKNYALSPDTGIGYEAFKDLHLSTPVIAYTIANLLENGVVAKTGDERYYFVEAAWNKTVRKVNMSYAILLGLPVFALIVIMVFKYLLN